jgi:hypothetical protein
LPQNFAENKNGSSLLCAVLLQELRTGSGEKKMKVLSGRFAELLMCIKIGERKPVHVYDRRVYSHRVNVNAFIRTVRGGKRSASDGKSILSPFIYVDLAPMNFTWSLQNRMREANLLLLLPSGGFRKIGPSGLSVYIRRQPGL